MARLPRGQPGRPPHAEPPATTPPTQIEVLSYMKLHAQELRRPASTIALLAAAAGLVLTGCGTSSGSNSGSAGASSPSSSATNSGGSATVTTSASAPFPDTVGDTWTYKNSIADGETSVNKVASVRQVSAGQEVKMDITTTVEGKASSSSASYILEPNGQISLPFSQLSQGSSSGFSLKVISGGVFWPSAAQIASGQTYHTTMKLEFDLQGKKADTTAHITVQGAGTQTVTVPAGTYNATVVEMTEAEKFEGYNITETVKTWLASGVGPVQSEVSSLDGSTDNVVNKQQLVSFVKG
jgi:hypothetical protein